MEALYYCPPAAPTLTGTVTTRAATRMPPTALSLLRYYYGTLTHGTTLSAGTRVAVYTCTLATVPPPTAIHS